MQGFQDKGLWRRESDRDSNYQRDRKKFYSHRLRKPLICLDSYTWGEEKRKEDERERQREREIEREKEREREREREIERERERERER